MNTSNDDDHHHHDPVGADQLPAGATRPAVAPRPPRTVRQLPRRQKLRLSVVFVILAGALGFLLAEGLSNSLNYFDTVDQALAHKDTLGTTTFRLEGVVDKCSITRTAQGADFSVSEGDHTVPVVNSGSPPQLFQPDIPVVVVGHFAAATSDQFFSNQIMVDHSNQYKAAYPNRLKVPKGTDVGSCSR